MKLKSLQRFFTMKYIHYYILGVIILIAAFLRFYDMPFRYGLSDETVREAVVGIEGARQKQAPLTGGFSSAGPFTWGPWFYYQMIIVSLLFPYNYAPWIYLTITTIICVVLLYKIGDMLKGSTFGLVLAFLGTISPSLIMAGTHLTFPNLTNVFGLLGFFIFIKLIKENISYWWSFWFGLVLGIALNIHYQMLGLMILPIILFFYKYKRPMYFIYAVLGIVITFIPLLLFELTNHWHNLRHILNYYLYGKERIYVPNRWLFYVRDFWPMFWGHVIGIPNILGAFFIVISNGVIIWQILKRKISVPLFLIFIAFLYNFILLRYYWGERSFGYLMYLRPFVFILTGYTIIFFHGIIIKKFSQKIGTTFLIIILAGITANIFPQMMTVLQRDPFTLEMYHYVNILESFYPNKNFIIYKCVNPKAIVKTHIVSSVVFLLDMRKKIDSQGVKIAVNDTNCRYPDSGTVDIPDTSLTDISKASNEAISKAYWKPYVFKDIYEPTARWWFKEQP